MDDLAVVLIVSIVVIGFFIAGRYLGIKLSDKFDTNVYDLWRDSFPNNDWYNDVTDI